MTGPREMEKIGAGGLVPTRMTVNGTPVELSVPARMTLSDALRDQLGLTGTHIGCEHGVCGMCTVLVDGNAARSCLMLACQADGAEVTTIEGIGAGEPSTGVRELSAVQAAFREHHALQCGFCTPGFVISATAFLREHPDPTDQQIRDALSGNLCRCTGYQGILAAVRAAADSIPTATQETTHTQEPR